MARSLGGGRRADRRGRSVRRDAGRRPHRALQPGGRGGAAARDLAALHRSASAGRVSRSQPRHRRRLRPDDSRSRHHPGDGAVGRRVDRSRRRAGADRRSTTSPTRGCASRPGASRTSPPAASARIACARSGSFSRTPTSRSTTPRRKSKGGGWCRGRGAAVHRGGADSRRARRAAAARAGGFRPGSSYELNQCIR